MIVRHLLQLITLIGAVALVTGLSPASAHQGSDGTASELVFGGAIDQLPELPAVIEVSRIHLATGASWNLTVPGPALYGVESGALGIRVDGPSELTRAAADSTPTSAVTATPGVDNTLRRGDHIIVRAGTDHIVRNDGQKPVSLLGVVLFPIASAIPSWLPEGERPSGVEVQPLAADVIESVSPSAPVPIELSVERIAIETGQEVVLPTGVFALLIVESGTLALTGQSGQAQELKHEMGSVVRLQPGVRAIARNDMEAPLILVGVRIGPQSDGEGSDQPASFATPSA